MVGGAVYFSNCMEGDAMWTRRLRPRLILVVAVGIVALLALNFSLAAAQVPIRPNVNITPAQPMGAIEFVQESGIERWQVKLTRGGSVEDVHLRISGSSCTMMGEIYQGMITPLYDDMSFRTKNGRTCTVQAIER
jgi:hypothetical protein